MGITLSSQTTTFLFSVALGALLSLFFDAVRIINAVLKNNRKRIFFEDVVYFILSAVITFMYILVVNMGEIRFYIIAGEIIGWILYRVTIGNYIYRFVLNIVRFIIKCLLKVKGFISSIIPKDKIEKLKKKFDHIKEKLKGRLKLKHNAKQKHKINKKINIHLNKNIY